MLLEEGRYRATNRLSEGVNDQRFNPGLRVGEPLQIAISAITAGIGIIFITATMEGYMLGDLTPLQRCLHGCVGLALLIPNGAAAWALPLDGVAVLGAILLIALGLVSKRRHSQPAPQQHSPSSTVTSVDRLTQ